IDLESRPPLCVTLGGNHQDQSAVEFDFEVPYVGTHGHMLDRLTLESRHSADHTPQILQVRSAHARRSASTWDNAASGIRSAWMYSDDFEVASNGYGVQNDKRRLLEAARNDNTSCHADVFARRSATASTCQTWSPCAITRHDMAHLEAGKGAKGAPI